MTTAVARAQVWLAEWAHLEGAAADEVAAAVESYEAAAATVDELRSQLTQRATADLTRAAEAEAAMAAAAERQAEGAAALAKYKMRAEGLAAERAARNGTESFGEVFGMTCNYDGWRVDGGPWEFPAFSDEVETTLEEYLDIA